MNTNLKEIRSKAMSLANKLRKEKGLNKSDALKLAWQEVKKENTEIKAETSKKIKRAPKKPTYLYDFKSIDDTRDYEIEHKVICFNLNYWSTTYNWCSSILIMAKSKDKAIRWARRNRKDFIFEEKDINVAQADEVFPSKPCVKAF